MEAEESDIQLKETTAPEIEEMSRQLTIWGIFPREFVEQSESKLETAA